MSTPAIQYSGPAIDPTIPWKIRQHIQLIYQKLGNHTQAFSLLQQAKTTSTTTVLEGSSTVINNGNSGSSGFIGQGYVNNQTGNTSYTTVAADNGVLLVLDDASPVAVTLTTDAPPYYLFITNFGAGTATLTPTTGTINGGASITLLENQTLMAVCDSTNWQTTSVYEVPIATTSVAGIVKPDGSTITITTGGVISASGGGAGGGGPAVYYRKLLGTSVNLTAYVPASIDAIVISASGGSAPAFPSTGGPWRVMVSYAYYGAIGSGRVGECRVVDQSGNIGAAGEGGQFDGDAGTCYQASGWMPVTYPGNATVTLTTEAVNSGAQTLDTTSVLFSNPSYMEIAIFSA